MPPVPTNAQGIATSDRPTPVLKTARIRKAGNTRGLGGEYGMATVVRQCPKMFPAAVLLPVGRMGGDVQHPVAGIADFQQPGEASVHLNLVAHPPVDVQLRVGDPPLVQAQQPFQ